MTIVSRKHSVVAIVVSIWLGVVPSARAQSAPRDTPWSVEFGIGWDNSVSGNINSSGIGVINDQAVVILRNSYEDVYGTGLHIRFGGGYMVSDETEIRATFSFQSLDADFVRPLGDIGVSRLYGQFTDYQALTLDVGLRRYLELTPKVRAYGEGTLGLGFIDEIDVTLVAPGANLAGVASDFYDQTAAFTLGGNVGVMFQTGERIDVFGQLGLRWMTGMSEVDNLLGTGLDNINDKSSRWTMPLIAGVRLRF